MFGVELRLVRPVEGKAGGVAPSAGQSRVYTVPEDRPGLTLCLNAGGLQAQQGSIDHVPCVLVSS